MIFLLIVPLVVALLWITGLLAATDFSIPLKNTKQLRRVLVIFPHADDEAITCSGSLHRLARRGCTVTLVILTKGEKGPRAMLKGNLKDIRTREAQAAAAILGISRLIQEDFGDGELSNKKLELKAFIAATIEQEKPDLLITYDLSGLYGHADHVICSEIITELKKTRFPALPLWYATFPKRVLARIRPPDDLAIDPHFQEQQALPTHKLFIGGSIIPKIKAWYTYQSQRAALAKGIGTFIPFWILWFLLSMVLFEYFAEAS